MKCVNKSKLNGRTLDMCRRIGSASFLAAAFCSVGRDKISYADLAVYRKRISEFHADDGQTYSVSWTQESLSGVFGGVMDVFRAQSDCVWCDLGRLPSVEAISANDGVSLSKLSDCFHA